MDMCTSYDHINKPEPVSLIRRTRYKTGSNCNIKKILSHIGINSHSLEVMSRYFDPQRQVSANLHKLTGFVEIR